MLKKTLFAVITALFVLTAGFADNPVRITLYRPYAAGQAVRFRFSEAMVKSSDLSRGDIPDITFNPYQKGTFQWTSAYELQFTPDEGYLNWGANIKVTAQNIVPLSGTSKRLSSWSQSFSIPYLQVAGKVAPWSIKKGQPRFISYLKLQGYDREIGSYPIYLLYDQEVDPKELQDYIQVKDSGGRRLQFQCFEPEADNIEDIYGFKIDPAMAVAVRIKNLSEEMYTVKLTFPEEMGADITLSTLQFNVNNRFYLAGNYIQGGYDKNRVPLNATWRFDFNNRFTLNDLKSTIEIKPEPVAMSFSTYGSDSFKLHLQLEPGTTYQLTSSSRVYDYLGNKLESPMNISFTSQDLPPVMNGPELPVYIEQLKNTVPMQLRNIGSIEARIYNFSSAVEFAKALKSTGKRRAIDYGLRSVEETINLTLSDVNKNILSTADMEFPKLSGFKCIEFRGAGIGSEGGNDITDTLLVQSTNLGITSKVFDNKVLVWVTQLSDVSTVSGADITIYNDNGSRIGSGKTDSQGVAEIAISNLLNGSTLRSTLIVAAKYRTDQAVSRLVEKELANPWQFSLPAAVDGGGVLEATVFNDRGVYRPGDTVHTKVILNKDYQIEKNKVTIYVKDPRGQQVLSKDMDIDSYNCADFDLTLKDNAPVGEYMIQFQYKSERLVHTFQVEEYRVPTFLVDVDSSADNWKRNTSVSAAISAEYLHGGSLSGRPVSWKVYRQQEQLVFDQFPGYIFSFETDASLAGNIATGEGQLDGSGSFSVDFRPNNPDSAGLMRYFVEASVTDVDRQSYSGRMSRLVHPGDYYVGLVPPPKEIMQQGETLTAPIIVVDTEGNVVKGIKVEVELQQVEYHTSSRMADGGSVQTSNREVLAETQKKTVTSGEGAVDCSFKLEAAGIYRYVATVVDSNYNRVKSGFSLTVSGGNTIAWPRFDNERIEIVADKESYKPGDYAQLIVKTPYEKAMGLLTLEQDGVVSYRVFKIQGDTPKVIISIEDSYAPNIFASVAIIRGREHHQRDASGFETGAPGFRMGYVNLKVEPTDRILSVQVEADEKTANPGDKVTITVKGTDYEGNYVGGKATVMVVDEAVLSLTGYKTPDPIANMFREKALAARTGTTLLDLPHSRRSRLEALFPGGGDDSILLSNFPMALRKLFMSTAYWNPDLTVKRFGGTKIELELPDNITTYRIMAVMVDEKGRIGASDSNIVVQKPLMIQPVMPRFAYPGDEFQVEALVFNGMNTVQMVTVAGSFEGLDFIGEKGTMKKMISPGETASFIFPVIAQEGEDAQVRFVAQAGSESDGAEYSLPILSPGTKRTIVESATMGSNGSIDITFPADRIEGSSRLEIVVSKSQLSQLKDAVSYLMKYPNGCIEQTTSTAYPLVVLKDLLPAIGVDVSMDDLKKFSEAGIKRILTFQTSSGGLSYWPGGSDPHAFGTAFGLTALIAAKERGYDVPNEALSKMADYLEGELRKGGVSDRMSSQSSADGDTRALFTMTLGRLGRPQPNYIESLWRSRSKLSGFGLSFLAIAAKEMNKNHPLIESILEEIRKKTTEDLKEAYFTGNPRGGWSMDSAIRTHGVALIAFAITGQDQILASKLLYGLLNRRSGGMWGNTQDNVFAIMGVHEFIGSGNEEGEGPSAGLMMDGRMFSIKSFEELSNITRRLSFTDSELDLSQNRASTKNISLVNRDSTPLVVTLRGEYELELTDENRRAQSEGFTLSRTYETMDGKPVDINNIPLGELIKVRLKIKNNQKLNYVAIDDKLPAGLEPLNTNLETTESLELGALTNIQQRSLGVLSYSEIRDHRVAFFVDEMAAGEYEYIYVARATTPGEFIRPAGRAEAMYLPKIYGTTSIDYVNIK